MFAVRTRSTERMVQARIQVRMTPLTKSATKGNPGSRTTPRIGREVEMRIVKVVSILALATVVSAAAVRAQDAPYPSRPVVLVVPFAAGGGVDIMGRTMAAVLSKKLSATFVVENRPGAGGSVASNFVARAAPDGYTLFVGAPGPMTVAPALFPDDKVDPIKQFDPIILFANMPGIVVTRSDLGVSNMRELVTLSKSQPGKLTMASAGTGSILQLMGEFLQDRIGFKWTHVPYKGSSPALAALMAKQVDVLVDVVPTAAPYVRSKDLTAIAVTIPNRSSQLPDVPTMSEAGYGDFNMGSWMALMAPKGTPPEIVTKLNQILNDALATQEMRDNLKTMGAELEGGAPQRVTERLQEELPRWKNIVETAGLRN
jgi:tripartite-type tricarboxylate transporter receptor subunit TctC